MKTLWENFVLVAPQAVNDEGQARYWGWHDAAIKRRVITELGRVVATGKADPGRIYAAGFSRGGLGCLQLDSATPPLEFQKILAADPQNLDELQAVADRKHQVRVYYEKARFSERLKGENPSGVVPTGVTFIPTDVSDSRGDAHSAICSKVFADDEVYRWLLGARP